MKKLIILPLVCLQLLVFGQNNAVLEGVALTDSLSLLALSGDESSNLNFLVIDPSAVQYLAKDILLGEKCQGVIDFKPLRLCLIKNKRIQDEWTIYLGSSCVRKNRTYYRFDIEQLKKIASVYPLHYSKRSIEIRNAAESVELKRTFLKDSTIFNFEMPELSEVDFLSQDGSFFLDFPNNEIFTSPAAISDYLQPIMEKIRPKNKFMIGYELSDYNIQNNGIAYRMSINCDKKLYDNFTDDKSVKSAWKPLIFRATYYKKN